MLPVFAFEARFYVPSHPRIYSGNDSEEDVLSAPNMCPHAEERVQPASRSMGERNGVCGSPFETLAALALRVRPCTLPEPNTARVTAGLDPVVQGSVMRTLRIVYPKCGTVMAGVS